MSATRLTITSFSTFSLALLFLPGLFLDVIVSDFCRLLLAAHNAPDYKSDDEAAEDDTADDDAD